MTEVTAPEGYEKAESIYFRVADDGTVSTSTDGKDYTALRDATVVMEDKEAKGDLVITKTISGNVTQEEAQGAISFKVTDPSGNESTYSLGRFTYENGKYTLKLTGMDLGTYTVEEVVTDITGKTLSKVSYTVDSALPVIGDTASPELKTVGVSANVAFENDYEDATKTVYLSKVDAANSQELPGAKLRISKNDNGSEGTVVKSWT